LRRLVDCIAREDPSVADGKAPVSLHRLQSEHGRRERVLQGSREVLADRRPVAVAGGFGEDLP
jgi:hypothetical protein